MGILFGLLFPTIATIIRITQARLPFGFAGIAAVQANDPLLWIIDTAPLFLGLFAAFAGRRQDRLDRRKTVLFPKRVQPRRVRGGNQIGREADDVQDGSLVHAGWRCTPNAPATPPLPRGVEIARRKSSNWAEIPRAARRLL